MWKFLDLLRTDMAGVEHPLDFSFSRTCDAIDALLAERKEVGNAE